MGVVTQEADCHLRYLLASTTILRYKLISNIEISVTNKSTVPDCVRESCFSLFSVIWQLNICQTSTRHNGATVKGSSNNECNTVILLCQLSQSSNLSFFMRSEHWPHNQHSTTVMSDNNLSLLLVLLSSK